MASRGAVTIASVCLIGALALAWAPGRTQEGTGRYAQRALLGAPGGQMLLRADQIDYDLNTSVATAHGHVEIDYNSRILEADRVTYDQNKDIVSAAGNVVIMAPNGDVAFANQATL